MDTECLLVYVTMPDKDSARTFSETLVRERFAACVNILDGAESIYWWQGALETATEAVCLFKTTRGRFPAFLEKAKALHPYDVPCIVAWPLERGNADFLDWIGAETAPR
ncbi:Divalent-cation tolerance protein CutA [uncultured delta proteobacterium]|uniref:Divalent-cation tolerance protein CutA n=1 Tax=uncultured delta proteobacterium TaxID=34034 RepID=A0A212KEZ6_9DELT|nr:Divalent-cation tolerance protein CutA [uncultured delta proteobacterium]